MLVQNSYGIGGTLRSFALVIGELQFEKKSMLNIISFLSSYISLYKS